MEAVAAGDPARRVAVRAAQAAQVMRRLLPALALALALAAPASAKELASLSVCGTNGCHTTKDKDELRNAVEVQPQPTPDHSGAFYRVRGAVTAPGQHDGGTMRSQWIPSLG